MPANFTSTSTAALHKAPKTAPASPPADGRDAIALLKADHEAVSRLFADYAQTHSAANKKSLVAKICDALTVHAQIEEEIFYPAVKAALKDRLLVPEASVEHAGIQALIAQLEGLEPDGEMYEAKVSVLGEYVRHHVNEEQNEMFRRATATALDMTELGARMAARRDDLLARRRGASSASRS